MAIKTLSNIVPESHEIATVKKLRKLAKKQKLLNWGIESEPLRLLKNNKTFAPCEGAFASYVGDPITHYRITFSWEEKE